MSYRYRLYTLEKAWAEKFAECKTNLQYNTLAGEYCKAKGIATYNFDNPFDDIIFPVYEIGTEIFNFGSNYNNAYNMYKHSVPLFKTKEFADVFDNEKPVILDKSGLICAVEHYRDLIIDELENTIAEKSKHPWDKRTSEDRCKAYVSSMLDEWSKHKELGDGFNVYDLNLENPNIASSWLYEFQIFDLVRIFKSFDWDNNVMLFLGW